MIIDKTRDKIQEDILNSLPRKPTGRLLLAPRVGKSRLAINLIKREQPKSILWVTPSAKLADEDILEEFTRWDAKEYLPKLTTVTYRSLHKIVGHFELIILDEEQHLTENNSVNLITKSLSYDYLITLTGTPTKHQNKKDLYFKLQLKVLYHIPLKEAVNMDLLADYSVRVVQVDLSAEKNIKAGNQKRPFLTSEIKQYQYLTGVIEKAKLEFDRTLKFKILTRMRFIHNSPSKLSVAKYLKQKLTGTKILFCSNIKQAETLSKHVYHSKTNDKALQSFLKGEIKELAMVNAGGVGFTYKNLDHLIITQIDSNKNGNTVQKACRTLLKQNNYKATIWIICLLGTQDEVWVKETLKAFNQEKITFTKLKLN